MPIYNFLCKNKKCSTDIFEEMCRYEEITQVRCPDCNSKRVEKMLTIPNISFVNPTGTSKMESDSYRWGSNLEKAQDLRRRAEKASHMGTNPYPDID